jgi:predicted nucleic acid-binding protein
MAKMASDLVLIDTCIRVSFFNRPQSAIRQAVDALIYTNRAAVIGPILAEVLCGFRRDTQADWVASFFEALQFPQLEWEDWRTAARLHRRLAQAGSRLPLTDLVLAAVALRLDCLVFTSDPHFNLIAGLKQHVMNTP